MLQPEARVVASWKTFQSHLRYLSSASQSRIKEAFLLGEKAHRGQMRKSGDSYFMHCSAVAEMLSGMHADEETMIAALLHDVVEDTPMTLAEIEEKFGQTVRALIDGVTKLSSADLGERSTLDGQTETLRKMFTLMQQDVRIMVIKLVDRLHNMQTAEFLPEEKRQSLAQETLDVYVKIADRLSMQDLRDELEELCLSILDLAHYERLLMAREKNEKDGQQVTKRMEERIRAMRPSFPVEILHERKTWPKLKAQLEVGETVVTGLSAATATFVCEDIDACYWMMGVLHQLWRRETLSFQDFINSPMINGYRGLHTTVILEDGTRMRCKIRTRDMQDYAHRGVASRCFTERAHGLQNLPWAERITPLAEGTMSRSEEFFAGLQSDILGESIVIHGPADQTVLLPKDATALDGAFYLFGDDALSLASVRLDGREVPFQTPLHHAVSLEVTPASGKTVYREWLYWVRTSLATTKVRAELARRHRWKKIEEGRNILQEVVTERGRGLLEEFDERSLSPRLQSLGFSSLDDACIAIAEGVCEPREIYGTLFGEKQGKPKVAPSRFLVRLSVQGKNIDTLRQLLTVYQKYNIHLGQIRIRPLLRATFERRITLSVTLTPEECEELRRDIARAGGQQVVIEPRFARRQHALVAGVLVTLWGFDPVMAKLLLQAGMAPLELTTLRFAIPFLLSALYLALLELRRSRTARLKRVSPFHTSLLLAGISIFCTAFFTYLALQHITASTYAALLNASTVFVFVRSPSMRKITVETWIFLLSTLGLLLLGILFLLMKTPTFLSIGPLAGIGAALGFFLYSIASIRYQLQESIRTRYPFFIFYLSLIALLCSLPFLLFSHFYIVQTLLLPAILFVLIFTALPYILYFELLKSEGVHTTGRYIPLFFPIVILGELLVYREWHWLSLPLVCLSFLWVLTYKESEKLQNT